VPYATSICHCQLPLPLPIIKSLLAPAFFNIENIGCWDLPLGPHQGQDLGPPRLGLVLPHHPDPGLGLHLDSAALRRGEIRLQLGGEGEALIHSPPSGQLTPQTRLLELELGLGLGVELEGGSQDLVLDRDSPTHLRRPWQDPQGHRDHHGERLGRHKTHSPPQILEDMHSVAHRALAQDLRAKHNHHLRLNPQAKRVHRANHKGPWDFPVLHREIHLHKLQRSREAALSRAFFPTTLHSPLNLNPTRLPFKVAPTLSPHPPSPL